MNHYDVAQDLIKEAQNSSGKLNAKLFKANDRILRLKNEIGEINSKINLVELVEPINSVEEKEKWLEEAKKGNFTNPKYVYDKALLANAISYLPRVEHLCEIVNEMHVLMPRTSFEQKMMQEIIIDLMLSLETAKAIINEDDEDAMYYLRQKYGMDMHPESEISLETDMPKKIDIVSDPVSSAKMFDAEEIAKFFSDAMGEYGFSWPVIISDTAAAIDVRDKSKNGREVVIPASRKVSACNLIRLMGHEIESHMRTSMNGMELFGYGGLDMKTDDETLYEGLALLSDKDFDLWFNGNYDGPKPWYAIATKLATSQMSFAEVAECIYECRKNEAHALAKTYTVTRRIFRGVSDSKNPAGYAFLKDLAYFNGFKIADELEKAGYAWLLELGSFDYRQLMIVLETFKVSPEMIPHKRIDLKNTPIVYELLS